MLAKIATIDIYKGNTCKTQRWASPLDSLFVICNSEFFEIEKVKTLISLLRLDETEINMFYMPKNTT
jgi:hypothetical protein